MKRERNAEEILISSDSEREEQADTEEEEEEEENVDADEEEEDDDNDGDDADDDDDDDAFEDDDADDDVDQDAYDDEDDGEEEHGDDEDIDENALSRTFEWVPACKAQKRAFSGFNGDIDAESSKEGKKNLPKLTLQQTQNTGTCSTAQQTSFNQDSYKKAGGSSTKPSWGRNIVAGRIVKESYGSDKQQHTFTVEVLWSRGPKQLPLLKPLLIKGRNLYRLATYRQQWPNEGERKRVLQEKHSRGDVARNAREDRISGKRHSCSSRTRLSKRKTRVTSKRKQRRVNFSQVNTSAGKPGSFKGKAWNGSQSKGQKGK